MDLLKIARLAVIIALAVWKINGHSIRRSDIARNECTSDNDGIHKMSFPRKKAFVKNKRNRNIDASDWYDSNRRIAAVNESTSDTDPDSMILRYRKRRLAAGNKRNKDTDASGSGCDSNRKNPATYESRSVTNVVSMIPRHRKRRLSAGNKLNKDTDTAKGVLNRRNKKKKAVASNKRMRDINTLSSRRGRKKRVPLEQYKRHRFNDTGNREVLLRKRRFKEENRPTRDMYKINSGRENQRSVATRNNRTNDTNAIKAPMLAKRNQETRDVNVLHSGLKSTNQAPSIRRQGATSPGTSVDTYTPDFTGTEPGFDPHKYTNTTKPRQYKKRTTQKRISLNNDCDYHAHRCMRVYKTGKICARTMHYFYKNFTNVCMMDYVNCMEGYEVWQVLHMGDCFETYFEPFYTAYENLGLDFLNTYYAAEPQ